MPFPDNHTDVKIGSITTTGRRTGRSHTVNMWFYVEDGVTYFICGDCPHSDWYANVLANRRLVFHVGDDSFQGTVQRLDDPAERRRIGERMRKKYGPFEGTIDVDHTEVQFYFEHPGIKVSKWYSPDDE